jgi:hypothetical protein
MNQRKTREEWQRILEDQKSRNLSDADCAQEHKVSVSQLKRWRSAVGGRRTAPITLVEIAPVLSGNSPLTIQLKRNAALEIPQSWPVGKITQLIRELGLV